MMENCDGGLACVGFVWHLMCGCSNGSFFYLLHAFFVSLNISKPGYKIFTFTVFLLLSVFSRKWFYVLHQWSKYVHT